MGGRQKKTEKDRKRQKKTEKEKRRRRKSGARSGSGASKIRRERENKVPFT